MDIRNWPLDKIMQLPDCCFGRKFWVGLDFIQSTTDPFFKITELALPEKCVVWELHFYVTGDDAYYFWIELALGDKLPASVAEFDEMEPVFRGLGNKYSPHNRFHFRPPDIVVRYPMREPIETGGRRFTAYCLIKAAQISQVVIGFLISSVPTEVPDWLISGRV